MLLNPKKQRTNVRGQIDSTDPFDAPIPGQSLTGEPGKYPWEHPPRIVNPDEAFEFIIYKIEDNPELQEDLDKFLMTGTPVESIVNTIAFTGFAEGVWSPDVAEMIKFPLSAYFAVRGQDLGFDLVMFNKEDTPSVTDENIINNLRENNPEAFELLKEELFKDEENTASFLDEAPPIDEEIIAEGESEVEGVDMTEIPTEGMLMTEGEDVNYG